MKITKIIKLSVTATMLTSSIVSASQTYQNDDLKTFIRDLHKNPQTVMGQLPYKVKSKTSKLPLTNQTMEQIVELKDSTRQNFCQTLNGSKVCLNSLEGRAAIANNDRAEHLVDNGSSTLKTLEAMDNRSLQSSTLPVQPWSDDYWAIANGVLGARYADPLWGNSLDWKVEFDEYNQRTTENYVLAKKLDYLSPSEKYDLLVGDKNFTLTKSMWREGKGYFDNNGSVETWMGICHGWAPAAYMVPRPSNAVTVLAQDGVTNIKFYPSDIKALVSLQWAKNRYAQKFIGGRCNTKSPSVDKSNGRVNDQECFDTNPGTWHKSVVNQIGVSKRSMVMDATFDYEVWNQPIVSYEYQYFNVNTGETSNDYQSSTIKLSEYSKDLFSKYRSERTKYIVGIEMDVKYVVETSPTQNEADDNTYDSITMVTYRYDLELNQDGKIIGGEWYTNAHPDFLWTPVKDARALSQADKYTPGSWGKNALVPTNWTRVAKKASEYGIPLAKVVEGLVKRSNK